MQTEPTVLIAPFNILKPNETKTGILLINDKIKCSYFLMSFKKTKKTLCLWMCERSTTDRWDQWWIVYTTTKYLRFVQTKTFCFILGVFVCVHILKIPFVVRCYKIRQKKQLFVFHSFSLENFLIFIFGLNGKAKEKKIIDCLFLSLSLSRYFVSLVVYFFTVLIIFFFFFYYFSIFFFSLQKSKHEI